MQVGAVFAALYAAHLVGDFWVQTGRQVARKGLPGWPGRRACAAHVTTYLATQAVALAALVAFAAVDLHLGATAAGLAVSGVTHYAADRRAPLRRLADLLDPHTGKTALYLLGTSAPGQAPCLGTGAHALDQSWHVAWLFAAALIIA